MKISHPCLPFKFSHLKICDLPSASHLYWGEASISQLLLKPAEESHLCSSRIRISCHLGFHYLDISSVNFSCLDYHTWEYYLVLYHTCHYVQLNFVLTKFCWQNFICFKYPYVTTREWVSLNWRYIDWVGKLCCLVLSD